MKQYVMLSNSELKTFKLAKLLATVSYNIGYNIYLYGHIGLGKTSFCKGFLIGLKYFGIVKSPTYTLVESYVTPYILVHHFDFYRVNTISELECIGIRDYFDSVSICLVEWPKFQMVFLPQEDISVTLEYYQSSCVIRQITLKAYSSRGEDIVEKLSFLRIKCHDETKI